MRTYVNHWKKHFREKNCSVVADIKRLPVTLIPPKKFPEVSRKLEFSLLSSLIIIAND